MKCGTLPLLGVERRFGGAWVQKEVSIRIEHCWLLAAELNVGNCQHVPVVLTVDRGRRLLSLSALCHSSVYS